MKLELTIQSQNIEDLINRKNSPVSCQRSDYETKSLGLSSIFHVYLINFVTLSCSTEIFLANARSTDEK